MMLVLVALFVLLGVVVLAIQVAEPAVDRPRARRQPPEPAAEAPSRPADRERIVLSVGIR
jgi:hypothetical protein